VILRCIGTATSTFGGGGGTKLFCSQALNRPNAATAKTARQTTAPLCPTAACGLLHASERSDFILRAPIRFVCSASAFYSNCGVRPSDKNSNNPLAGEPETENDAAHEIAYRYSFLISLLLKRRLRRRQKRFIQMINTLTRAPTLGALMLAALCVTAIPALSQAPSQAQRDAIKSQCRSDYMAHCSSIPPGGEASL
jgi:hypothetical protein